MQKNILQCAYNAHERIAAMDEHSQTQLFKNEHFVQWILYEEFRKMFQLNLQVSMVDMEFQPQALQGGVGKPPALDFALHPTEGWPNQQIIAIEMKRAHNWGEAKKSEEIAGDLARLAYLLQTGHAVQCYFIMFGLTEDIEGISYPGFTYQEQQYLPKSMEATLDTTQIKTGAYLDSNFKVKQELGECATELGATKTGVKVWSVSLG